ncbi:DUF6056 family protein [Latilactobacillus curvatus]|uniref:DUF6056 family protein n=1 Tax=Latilactobacillus curvatus TaxID=28038 RepID=UPI00223B28EB|nr:DUF6056 family protein [Latilactobacillus curvatus]MCS8618081.1 hypothetical protein [Latilactobacillus curvatus]
MIRRKFDRNKKSINVKTANIFNKILDKKIYFILVAIFAFFSWYSWIMPLVADDLAWGQMTIHQYVTHGQFAGINDGRFVANALMIVLAKSNIGLALYFGLTLMIIFYLMYRILSRNTTSAIWIFITLLILPRIEFAQIYNYNSGFINYVSSLIMPLTIILMAKKYILEEKNKRSTSLLVVGIFCLTFVFQFFSEPTTILNIALSITFIIFAIVKNRRVQGVFLSTFFGSVLGAIMMFFSGAYGGVANGNDGYRKINIDLIQILKFISSDIIPVTLRNNKVLIISIIIISLVAIIGHLDDRGGHQKTLLIILLLLHVTSGLVLVSPAFINNVALNLLISFLFIISGCLITLIRIDFKSNDWWLSLCCYLSALLLISPFFLISPFGERNVFGPQLFLLLGSIVGMVSFKRWQVYVVNIFLFGTLIYALAFFVKLGNSIGYASNTSIEFVQFQLDHKQKSKELIYLEVPNRNYLWHYGDPGQDEWVKIFYKFPRTSPKKVIPYATWTKEIRAVGTKEFFRNQL